MYSSVLSVPAPRVSGWVAETDPKYARAWLAALPLANSTEAAREIYQALYTLNRVDLKAQTRLELMALYDPLIGTVCGSLQSHLMHVAPPLGPKKRQLAEFIRRLHIEMAYGYKCCLRDLSRARMLMGRKSKSIACIERALYHLSEVLLRSYLVYQPYPSAVWREIHELYRLAESLEATDELVERPEEQEGGTTIAERYVQTLLLGLVNPYQLPHDGAQQLHLLLKQWGKQARIASSMEQDDASGCFLIDLSADTPPVPMTQKVKEADANMRVLNARLLLQRLQHLVVRMEAGESFDKLGLGVDCLESTCADLLRRMTRALGETARRRYARRQRSTNVFICVGLNAVHFFASGQRPFANYLQTLPWLDQPDRPAEAADTAFIDLEETPPPASLHISDPPHAENYRVDRWQLRDISPQGMSLARYGDAGTPVRVGELFGVQQPNDLGRWRVAVVRWVKSPESNSIEVGIELLAAGVTPVVVRSSTGSQTFPALHLPMTDTVHRPATLLLARGICHVGDEIQLIDEAVGLRRVRVLRLLERTGAFEQIVYAESLRR